MSSGKFFSVLTESYIYRSLTYNPNSPSYETNFIGPISIQIIESLLKIKRVRQKHTDRNSFFIAFTNSQKYFLFVRSSFSFSSSFLLAINQTLLLFLLLLRSLLFFFCCLPRFLFLLTLFIVDLLLVYFGCKKNREREK